MLLKQLFGPLLFPGLAVGNGLLIQVAGTPYAFRLAQIGLHDFQSMFCCHRLDQIRRVVQAKTNSEGMKITKLLRRAVLALRLLHDLRQLGFQILRNDRS